MVFQRQHFLVLTSTFALLLLLCSTAEAKCRIKPSTTVAYYGGHGATSDCQSWEDHFFSWWATAEPRVVHAKVLPSELKECDDLAQTNVTLWVQPGGNAYDQQASLGAEGKANLLRFIRAGQGQQQGERSTYLGTCAGFFLTASSYWWEGQQFSWPNMLGITPELEGSITTIWDDATPPGYVVTNVTHLDGLEGLDGSAASSKLSMRALYWGGPTRGWKKTPASPPLPGTKVLEFASIPGDLPAGVLHENVLLLSVHLEAFPHNPPAPANTLTEAETLVNYRTRAALINRATGANWKIPTAL